jgi:hypothetical protein
MPGDWAELQIEPTADLTAIKRAYAVRLRQTRPDDDAAAYQRLREAYDRLVQWARHAATHDVPAAPEAPQPAPLPADEPAIAPTAQTRDTFDLRQEPEGAPEPWGANPQQARGAEADEWQQQAQALRQYEPPEQLVDRLVAAWRAGGEPGLEAVWPQVHEALRALPLGLVDQASRAFADWVLGPWRLPEAVVLALCEEFGWFVDYRAAQQLGTDRLEALRQAIGVLAQPPVTDPKVLEDAKPVLGFARLLQRRAWLRAWAFAAMLGQPLPQLWWLLSTRLGLRRLGIDPATEARMPDVLRRARLLRWVLAFGVLWAGVSLVGPPLEDSFGLALSLALLAFGVWLPAAAIVHALSQGERKAPRWPRLEAFRRSGKGGALGLALVLAALVGVVLARSRLPQDIELLAWSLGVFTSLFVGVWLAWPLNRDAAWTLYGAGVMTVLWLNGGPGDELGLPGLLGVLLWMLFTAWLQGRNVVGRGDWTESLTGLMIIVTAPYYLMLIEARRAGWRSALFPPVLVMAMAHASAQSGGARWNFAAIFAAWALMSGITTAVLARGGHELVGWVDRRTRGA